ncbi:DMT family transporter [Pseudomonas benzenivorans]|uniref:DMT family transporter n=1 Tax=Pseudomonas benzenivorans TaxID=556533 RepID=A0ABZ0PX18_9PSED|nr:DMT family transporter [Pseudomonas benzenivorans]WPC05730.1 DMT family transporter [Pseudomonas benzenivorans]
MPAPIWRLLARPFVAGTCLPRKTATNGQLAKQVSGTLSAALISFLVGRLAQLMALPARAAQPRRAQELELVALTRRPARAFFLFAAFAGPRLGSLQLRALSLPGQPGMALTISDGSVIVRRHSALASAPGC